MANSYSAVTGTFIIDTSTNVSGLIALKGSAPAATDVMYGAERATFTNDQAACALKKIFMGDNPGLTATLKSFNVVVNSGCQLSLADTTTSAGFTGINTVSNTITLNGPTAEIISVTSGAISNLNISLVQINFKGGGKLTNWDRLWAGASYNMSGTITFANCPNGFWFSNTTKALPTIAPGTQLVFSSCNSSIRDATTTSPIDFSSTFSNADISIYQGGTADRQLFSLNAAGAGTTRHLLFRESTANMIAAPAFSGVATLTDNGDGTITATWAATTHPTGDTVFYRIYIQAGSATTSFGEASAQLLCRKSGQLQHRIGSTPDGAALVAGTAYYVTIRAMTALSLEDANTTALNVTPAATPAPVWSGTAGCLTLTDNADLTLTATCGHANGYGGEDVLYSWYLQAGSAPISFGVTATAFLARTTIKSILVSTLPDGSALTDGVDYYVICKAAGSAAEDSNVTAKNAVVTNTAAIPDVTLPVDVLVQGNAQIDVEVEVNT